MADGAVQTAHSQSTAWNQRQVEKGLFMINLGIERLRT
jgi:hypothetical protein